MTSEQQRIYDLRKALEAIVAMIQSNPNKVTGRDIGRAAEKAITADSAALIASAKEVLGGKTYAIKKLQYALIDPKGVPLSLHGSINSAVGEFASRRKPADIILDEASRQRIFAALLRKKYSIRKCYAWVRIGGDPITKLPPEKKG